MTNDGSSSNSYRERVKKELLPELVAPLAFVVFGGLLWIGSEGYGLIAIVPAVATTVLVWDGRPFKTPMFAFWALFAWVVLFRFGFKSWAENANQTMSMSDNWMVANVGHTALILFIYTVILIPLIGLVSMTIWAFLHMQRQKNSDTSIS